MEMLNYSTGKKKRLVRSVLALIVALSMLVAYGGFAPTASYADDDATLTGITVTDNTGLVAGVSASNTVTLTPTLNPDEGMIPNMQFKLVVTDSGITVDNWKTYFDDEQSTIENADYGKQSLNDLLANKNTMLPGVSTITLVPRSAAVDHTFKYAVTASKGDTNITSNVGTLAVNPDIESLTVTDNLDLAVGADGQVTFSAILDPSSAVRDVTTKLNLTDGDAPVADWKTFFDASKSTIKYGDFDAIPLSELFDNPADLYPGKSMITLVPLPAASGHTFTYNVTVSKGNMAKTSNTGNLKVAELDIITVTPEIPEVDDSGVAEAVVTEKNITDALAEVTAAKAIDPNIEAEIRIDVPSADKSPVGVAVSLPTDQIDTIAKAVDKLIINTEAGEFELGSAALSKIAGSASGTETVTLSITKEDSTVVPPEDQTVMAGASIFEIEIKAGQNVIHELGSAIKVSLPYTLKSGETAENVKVYYLPEQGDPQKIAATTYDSAATKISFPTDHLSLWAVKAEDTTLPGLSSGKVSRTSETDATVGFNTDKSGTAYYAAVQSGAAAPTSETIISGGEQLGAVNAGDVADKPVKLSKGAKDIYVVVKDKEGNVSAPLDIAAATVKVTFNAANGTQATVVSVKSWDSIKLSKPERAHYTFTGWYEGETNVGKAGTMYEATKDVTLQAKWNVVKYNIHLNANGGKVSKQEIKTFKKDYGSKLGKLTKPVRKGYAFKGWYTNKHNGAKISASKKVVKNITYYAQWQRTGKLVNGKSIKIMSKSSQKSSVKAKKPSGTKVTIISKKGNWYKIKFGSKTGYVLKKYVKLSPTK